MSVLGKQYRTKAKAIFTALEAAVPTADGADIVIGDEKIHIPRPFIRSPRRSD